MAFATLVDRYVSGNSLLHRLDARVKLAMTLAFIFCAILTPTAGWYAFLALGGLICVATWLARLSPVLVVRRSLLALPFTLAAVPVIFNHPGPEVFTVPLFGWTATDEGLRALASILLRSWLSILAATLLTATTEAESILQSLRAFGVPKLLVGTVSFMWRYIFVIVEETRRMIVARQARSARPAGRLGGSLTWRARVAGSMVGTLFLRSLNRSERVYVAMLARGYNGEVKSLEQPLLHGRDYVALAVTLAAVLGIQAYARI